MKKCKRNLLILWIFPQFLQLKFRVSVTLLQSSQFSLDENQRRNDTTTAHIAIREALANTLVHCAYTVSGNITIDRYMDRIVMSNPGTMLVSLEEYFEGGHSVCRNPLLQKMFIFLGIGEKGGSGADVIVKGWKDNGWETPSLAENRIRIELRRFFPYPQSNMKMLAPQMELPTNRR